jgi:predicted RNase H-related nuclease YkuK (DUF458 family)
MRHIKPFKWRRFNGEQITEPIELALQQDLQRERDKGFRLKVCIGSDSQVRGNIVDMATVIVVLREKSGGFMYIRNEALRKRMTLKERLLAEVTRSIDVAYNLCDLLDRFDVDMEVHADINTNPHFKSNASLHDAMGYILGMGFAFKAKPEAFASSSCANKVV